MEFISTKLSKNEFFGANFCCFVMHTFFVAISVLKLFSHSFHLLIILFTLSLPKLMFSHAIGLKDSTKLLSVKCLSSHAFLSRYLCISTVMFQPFKSTYNILSKPQNPIPINDISIIK